MDVANGIFRRPGRDPSPTARRELDAAGIQHPALRTAYRHCRDLHAAHGRTYYLAARLLPPERRPAVHALYGFARWVDDVVDEPGPANAHRAAEIARIDAALHRALTGGTADRPVLAAVADTARRYRLPAQLFTDFMRSMRMDLHVTGYPDRAALDEYVHGSAGVIGLQVLPVLGTTCSRDQAAPHAAKLGHAFQLTNFLRDVGEDLDRGRVYLPADELAAFGVDAERLHWCRRTGRPDGPVRRALADQVARTRALYRQAEAGIPMLDPVARPCVATAHVLYGEILDRVVESGYRVFGARIAVPTGRRLGVAAPALLSAVTARARTAAQERIRR
ncbi:phytoene/squalene synthase family protein [Saccharopolyspora gloriosae]|uniref:phytoene/squalene synthase family protein n=1 Tax=Saccharopolyspora gloriosae TaxID=455344 RepID=UPI001FB65A74|nr:phytoene/squalene synthase family protein [Saccharopolyspora gloriosae]